MEKSYTFLSILFLIAIIPIVTAVPIVEARSSSCRHSGRIRGKKFPHGACNKENDSECCRPGKSYVIYNCSPTVTNRTNAVMTINSFEKNGDGGGPSECDNKFHPDKKPVVALSTGWFNKRKRCNKYITIHGNGRSVKAMVVDECDSTMGCDKDHDFQPPCPHNIVDASAAVWEALGVPKNKRGQLDVFWSDV